MRTFCVRLCDGYYFPISFSTPRHKAGNDANQCAASCNGEARLFITTGEINDAHDLTGRAYTSLPNAFLYRKRYVSSCTCRPAPWTQAERNRHNRYAIAEGRAPEYSNGDVRVVAGNGSDGLTPPEVIAGRPATLPPSYPAGETPVETADATPPAVTEAVPVPRASQAQKEARQNPRKTLARATEQVPNRTAKAPFASPPWSLGATTKYSWPGDPPSRYR